MLAPAEMSVGLTDSIAITPAASISGFYFAHSVAANFNVGKIAADQGSDWSQRMAMNKELAEQALAPLL